MNATTSASAPVGRAQSFASSPGWRAVRGMLLRDWMVHRAWMAPLMAAWVLCTWVLMVFFSPGLMMLFGVVWAWVAAVSLGGSDIAEGCEEFTFSLPPTRRQRFLVRLALGGLPLLAMLVVGFTAVAFDLPQTLWGLFVETGFTEPFDAGRSASPYATWTAAILYAYITGFAAAAGARSGSVSRIAGTLGVLGGLLLINLLSQLSLLPGRFLGALINSGPIRFFNGVEPGSNECAAIGSALTVAVAVVLGAAGLGISLWRYGLKEGISRPTPVEMGMPRWLRNLFAGGVVLFLAVFIAVRRVSVPAYVPPQTPGAVTPTLPARPTATIRPN